jgi:hypothetical protein
MQQDCCSEVAPSARRATPEVPPPTRQNKSARGFRPSNPAATGRRKKPAPPCSHRRWGSVSVAAHHLSPPKLHHTITVPTPRRCVGRQAHGRRQRSRRGPSDGSITVSRGWPKETTTRHRHGEEDATKAPHLSPRGETVVTPPRCHAGGRITPLRRHSARRGELGAAHALGRKPRRAAPPRQAVVTAPGRRRRAEPPLEVATSKDWYPRRSLSRIRPRGSRFRVRGARRAPSAAAAAAGGPTALRSRSGPGVAGSGHGGPGSSAPPSASTGSAGRHRATPPPRAGATGERKALPPPSLEPARLLTVKIRQPSHEFTFGVGMSFIPYPLVLTPVV